MENVFNQLLHHVLDVTQGQFLGEVCFYRIPLPRAGCDTRSNLWGNFICIAPSSWAGDVTRSNLRVLYILPTPTSRAGCDTRSNFWFNILFTQLFCYKQGVAQGQYLSKVQLIWIQRFLSPKVKELHLPFYLPVAGFISFSRVNRGCRIRRLHLWGGVKLP